MSWFFYWAIPRSGTPSRFASVVQCGQLLPQGRPGILRLWRAVNLLSTTLMLKRQKKRTTQAPISINFWTVVGAADCGIHRVVCALSLARRLRRRRSICVSPTDAIPSVNSVRVVTPERRHTMDNENVADAKIIECERVTDKLAAKFSALKLTCGIERR